MADINWEPYISTRAHKASQSLPDKIFLNKDDYHDPLKNIEELLFSL